MSYDGLTDPLGQSQILPYILHLSKNGYTFRIISFEKAENFQRQKADILDLIKDFPIQWIPLNYHKRPPVISTVLDIKKLKQTAKKEILKKKPQIIHCRSYLTSTVAIKLSKKYNTRFLFDMRGFYADERVEGNVWSLRNPIYKLVYNYLKKKEKAFFNNADHTVSLTENGKNEILSWGLKGLNVKDITVIPCCTDYNHFNIPDPFTRNSIRQKLNIKDDQLVLGYLGSLGTWYLVEEMLFFFKKLKEKYSNAVFLIISHQDIEAYRQQFRALNISGHDLISISANRIEVPDLMAAIDLGISFIKPSFSKKASSPTKVGEMLAMGIPMIVNRNVGDMDYIFGNNEFGCLVDSDNQKTYETAINRLPEILKLPKQNIRDQSRTLLDLKTRAVKSYLNIYNYLKNGQL